MALFNDIYCQICDRFYTKEQWNKYLYSSRLLHRGINGYWPAFFPQRKHTKDKGIKLEKAFWEMNYNSVDVLALYDFLKLYFTMCTNINNYVPVRNWFVDPNEEEQWGYGYRDDMIGQFGQDFYNKNFTLQDQGKDDSIDTLENRIKFWIIIVNNDEGSIPDNLYDYDYNDERLDYSLRGAEIFPDRGELKKLLDILRSEWVRKIIKYLLTKFIPNHLKRIISQTKLMFIISRTFGV